MHACIHVCMNGCMSARGVACLTAVGSSYLADLKIMQLDSYFGAAMYVCVCVCVCRGQGKLHALVNQ